MKNSSGIAPAGDRVLILPEEVEKTTKGGIIIPETETGKYQMAQVFGRLVAVGPDCWSDYSGPFAKVGDRVMFAKYGGLQFKGADGVQYRLSNDTDITALVDENVDFSEFSKRERIT